MDKRYQALLERRAEIEAARNAAIEQYEGLLASAGVELTDEQRSQADAFESQISAHNGDLDQVNADIAREERARELRRQRAATSEPRQSPVNISGLRDRDEADPMWGFATAAEYGLAVMQASHGGGVIDDRLRRHAAPSNYHRETGAAEGYLVPPEVRQQIWELVYQDGSEIIDRVDFEPTASNQVDLIADETTPWGSAGIKAYWRSEASQMSATRIDLEGRATRLHELYAFVLATQEVLQDSPRLTDRMTRGAASAIRWAMSEAVVNGNGVGKPLGWLQSSALVTVAKETDQSADTVTAMNVAKMYSRLIGPGNGTWLINQDVLPQLFTMTLDGNLLYTPPNTGFQGAPGGFLMGRPIVLTEHADTVGDQNDIQFINFAGYHAIRRSNAPEFASSIHLYFDYGVEAFRWTFRVGGQPFLSAPVSPNNGSNTRSHFVTLAARG
ncbi:MAG: phage major capsid protein [Pigmentiphaga sp.]